MPSEKRKLHGFTVVSGTLGVARQLLLPAILGGASAGGDITGTLQWILAILAIPSVLLAFARWMAFRFEVTGHDLVIDSGVLSRRRRVIPLARIQNIDLEQGPLQRLAGMAELRMETASGGGETEASLAVLALTEARELQAELLRLRAEARLARGAASTHAGPASPAAEDVPPGRELLRLSPADLVLAGATSNEAGLIAAGLAALLELADTAVGFEGLDPWIEGVFTRGMGLGVLGGLALAAAVGLGFVVLGWIVSVFVSVVRYHGFTLSRTGDELKRSYGLFSRHHSTVPLERVQAVRIEETLLRRPLGLVALKIETAGAGPRQQQGAGGGSEAFVPIARRTDVARLLKEVFEDAELEGAPLHPVSPLARRRSFARLAIPVLLAAAATVTVLGAAWLAVLVLLLPAWLYARADYRARAWGRPRPYALVRGGVFTRVSWVVPERKIQTLHVRDSPFQRRLGLATLFVDTAAGGRVPRVVDLELETARDLLAALAGSADGGATGSAGFGQS